jgi:hypothetical protein
MANFMGYVNGNLPREVNKLHDWSGSVWGRRHRSIPVYDEEEAQIARLEYIRGKAASRKGRSRARSIGLASPAPTSSTRATGR